MNNSIFNKIPYGRENAIRRSILVSETGMPDRRLREALALANAEGVYIINDGDGRGYYRPDTTEEKLRYYRSEYNRAISILKKLKPLRKELKESGCDLR